MKRDEELRQQFFQRVMDALSNPTRTEILQLLSKNERELSFTEIKKELGIRNNAALSHHLNKLQRACLIKQIEELGDPQTTNDPYRSFYSMTSFGKALLPYLQSIQDTIKQVGPILDKALVAAFSSI
jgi:DNA-binding HxlR family transcriptional regulator